MIFSLVVRDDKESKLLSESIKKALLLCGYIYDENDPELIIFIGGDGTFLRAVHKYLPIIDRAKFVGINTGTLGFFCTINQRNVPDIISFIKNKDWIETKVPLLKTDCRIDEKTNTIYAINEVRLENPFHTLIGDVFIDGIFLETYRGNGIVISSSHGSTAYNKSLGGAVIDSSKKLMQITEIAPIKNNFYCSLGSSLILDGNSKITISGSFSKIVVGYDHQVFECEGKNCDFSITTSDKCINLLRTKDYNSINILHNSFILNKEEKWW